MRRMTDHTAAPTPSRQFAPLAIILGIPLVFAAIFFYTSPVTLVTGGDQGIFKCGSPSSPNTDAKNVCDDPEGFQRNQAIYSGLSGVTLLGLGLVWMVRGAGHDEDEWDDDGPRRGRDDDIDLRSDGPRERRALRSGVPERRVRRDGTADPDEEPVDDRVDEGRVDEGRVDDGRSTRRPGRRSVLRDDDFADPEPRRRREDDWSSDGWR